MKRFLRDVSKKVNYSIDLQRNLSCRRCEGVFRAEKEADLIQVIEPIGFKQHGTSFAIENYCDRHEIDTSFISFDGDLLFFEASGDFSKDSGLIDV
jgi:hypothetical protein